MSANNVRGSARSKFSDTMLTQSTCGVHHDLVASVRAEKEATGGIRQLDQRTGKDGKKRKAPAKQEANRDASAARRVGSDPTPRPTEVGSDPTPATKRTKSRQPQASPVQYDPAFCLAMVDYCWREAVIDGFAESIGVSHDTIGSWMVAHAEFDEAVNVCWTVLVAALERRLLISTDAEEVDELIRRLEVMAPKSWANGARAPHHPGCRR